MKTDCGTTITIALDNDEGRGEWLIGIDFQDDPDDYPDDFSGGKHSYLLTPVEALTFGNELAAKCLEVLELMHKALGEYETETVDLIEQLSNVRRRT